MLMKIKMPVTWEICGVVEVEADTLAAAIGNFDPRQHHLPLDSEYVDGSFRLTSESPDEVPAMPHSPTEGVKDTRAVTRPAARKLFSVIGYYEDNGNKYYDTFEEESAKKAAGAALEIGVIAVAVFEGNIANPLALQAAWGYVRAAPNRGMMPLNAPWPLASIGMKCRQLSHARRLMTHSSNWSPADLSCEILVQSSDGGPCLADGDPSYTKPSHAKDT